MLYWEHFEAQSQNFLLFLTAYQIKFKFLGMAFKVIRYLDFTHFLVSLLQISLLLYSTRAIFFHLLNVLRTLQPVYPVHSLAFPATVGNLHILPFQL